MTAPAAGRVAFIGLGAMGSAMAAVLLRAGVDLTVWNRSANAAGPLESLGARVAADPAQAAADADTVITMLSDDAALAAVMEGAGGALATLRPGTLHLSMSTIAADSAERWAGEHAQRQQLFVAAPVFGRPQAAAEGALFTVAAGAEAALAQAVPLLELLGQRNFVVGEQPAQACAMKLAGNFMIMAATEALGEAMAVAGSAGIEAATVQEVLTGTIFNTPLYHAYGAMLVEERFAPAGFTAELGLKDMSLFDQLAERGQVPTPFLGILRDRLRTVIDRRGPQMDWAAVGMVAREDTGRR